MTASWLPKTMNAGGTICPNLTMNDCPTETWWVSILRARFQLTEAQSMSSNNPETTQKPKKTAAKMFGWFEKGRKTNRYNQWGRKCVQNAVKSALKDCTSCAWCGDNFGLMHGRWISNWILNKICWWVCVTFQATAGIKWFCTLQTHIFARWWWTRPPRRVWSTHTPSPPSFTLVAWPQKKCFYLRAKTN